MDGTGYITTKEAKRILGVKEDALRKWADNGLFPSIRTPGGQRLYNINKFLAERGVVQQQPEEIKEQQKFCYCRVSSQGQKDDLQRQVAFMQEKFPNHKIITDIGSGINFKRKGLRSILELASKGCVSEVVVAYRDRLCRFAFELIEWIFQLNGVKLLVLNESMESSGQSELAEDLLAIVNVFSCRVNGRRKYSKGGKGKNKQTEEVNQSSGEQDSEGEVVS